MATKFWQVVLPKFGGVFQLNFHEIFRFLRWNPSKINFKRWYLYCRDYFRNPFTSSPWLVILNSQRVPVICRVQFYKIKPLLLRFLWSWYVLLSSQIDDYDEAEDTFFGKTKADYSYHPITGQHMNSDICRVSLSPWQLVTWLINLPQANRRLRKFSGDGNFTWIILLSQL